MLSCFENYLLRYLPKAVRNIHKLIAAVTDVIGHGMKRAKPRFVGTYKRKCSDSTALAASDNISQKLPMTSRNPAKIWRTQHGCTTDWAENPSSPRSTRARERDVRSGRVHLDEGIVGYQYSIPSLTISRRGRPLGDSMD